MIIFQKFNNYRKYKNVVFLLTTLLMTAWQSQAQQLISVPFEEGFIGVIGSNTQQANNIQSYASLGINRLFFQQTTNSGNFEAQGNDINGNLLVEMLTGQTFNIDGNIVWRISTGGTVELFGFLANSGTSLNLNTYGGSNYTITGGTNSGNSTFGLIKVSSSYTFSNGSNVSGNAAGVLGDLNAYLSETTNPANLPAGLVTVNNLTTQNNQPTITGTVFLNQANNETLNVNIDGVLYNTSNGLQLDGNNNTWSLTIPSQNALNPGQTYEVTAPITSGFTSTDQNSTDLDVPGLYTVTITDDNGCEFVLEIFVESRVGLDQIDINLVNVYPNPNNGAFTVDFGGVKEQVSIQVIDAQGPIVKQLTFNNTDKAEMNLDAQKGVYSLQINADGTLINKKIALK